MKLLLSVSLSIFVILLSVALGEEYIDYRLVNSARGRRVARAANPKCGGTPGPICENCKDIHMCNNDKTSTLVWTCLSGETCSKGACITTDNPACSALAELKFICSSEGIFPDPADCFKYHICVNSQSVSTQPPKFVDYPRTCTHEPDDENVYKFNPKTNFCDKDEPTKECTTLEIPLCTQPVQRGQTVSNPSVYYICKKYVLPGVIEKPNSPSVLYPYQYVCPNGKEYDSDKFVCKAKGAGGSAAGGTAS